MQQLDKMAVEQIKKNSDPLKNNFFIMVNSGSKGSINNYKSVCMFLGE